MSRLIVPGLLATPFRRPFGSAATTRSAKILAKCSARASKGCEERLGIGSTMLCRGCGARGADAFRLCLVHELEDAVDGGPIVGLERAPHLKPPSKKLPG